MKTFAYVENYLLVIGGYAPDDYNQWGAFLLNNTQPGPKLDLSRLSTKEQNIIANLLSTISSGVGLTDRQAIFAESIIRRLLPEFGAMDIELPATFAYKEPVRILDRTQLLSRSGDTLAFKFAFNQSTVEAIKKVRDGNQGRVCWNKNAGCWELALTEYNLTCAIALAQSINVPVDGEVLDLYNSMSPLLEDKYAIELDVVDGEPIIRNGADSLNEWLTEHKISGDLIKMADYAGAMAYQLSSSVTEALTEVYGSMFVECCANKEINVQPNDPNYKEKLDAIIAWAKAVGRFPIVDYSPTALKTDAYLDEYFERSEILKIPYSNTIDLEIPPGIKLIYASRDIKLKSIPLLITKANLMLSSSRRNVYEKAEKVVWNCIELPRVIKW